MYRRVTRSFTKVSQLINMNFKIQHEIFILFLLHLGDVLYSIYFIREGQVEVLQNTELQAILGRNDVLGESPYNTMTPGKSRCIVRGLNYCTLNKIHRDDLLDVLRLYPDFANSFMERFRVTFDLRQVKKKRKINDQFLFDDFIHFPLV